MERGRGEEGNGMDPPPFRKFLNPPLQPDNLATANITGKTLKLEELSSFDLFVIIFTEILRPASHLLDPSQVAIVALFK